MDNKVHRMDTVIQFVYMHKNLSIILVPIFSFFQRYQICSLKVNTIEEHGIPPFRTKARNNPAPDGHGGCFVLCLPETMISSFDFSIVQAAIVLAMTRPLIQ
jgi:hypothetical protein